MPKTCLIVLGGFAGAGKTTLASQLAPRYNFPVYSTDKLNDVLRPLLHKSFREVSPLSYEITWHLITVQLKLGVSLILDTHMCTKKVWDDLDLLIGKFTEVEVIPIILQCDLEIHRQRIEKRGREDKEHLNLGGEAIENILSKYDFIERLKRRDLIRVDANGSKEEVFKAVDSIIQEKRQQL